MKPIIIDSRNRTEGTLSSFTMDMPTYDGYNEIVPITVNLPTCEPTINKYNNKLEFKYENKLYNITLEEGFFNLPSLIEYLNITMNNAIGISPSYDDNNVLDLDAFKFVFSLTSKNTVLFNVKDGSVISLYTTQTPMGVSTYGTYSIAYNLGFDTSSNYLDVSTIEAKQGVSLSSKYFNLTCDFIQTYTETLISNGGLTNTSSTRTLMVIDNITEAGSIKYSKPDYPIRMPINMISGTHTFSLLNDRGLPADIQNDWCFHIVLV